MSDPERRHPNVINLSEIELRGHTMGSKFGYQARRLGTATGARSIGCSWFEVEPGRTSFPHHFHCANEEAIFILDGEGTARIGEARVPVRAGDYLAFPPGPAGAHQLLNTGTAPLRYLCVSTMHPVEVAGYPDSGKVGAMAMPSAAGGDGIRKLYKDGGDAGYYDGEDIGTEG